MRLGVQAVVYQSFRTENVPPWIDACLRSTREWAASRGFEYRFMGDEFLGYCPPRYRGAAANNVLLVSDLARLIAAGGLLDEGYDRAIWVDADVLVFAPAAFDVETGEDFAFNTELWVNREQGRYVGWRRVNNAVCTFDRDNAFLPFYIQACQRIVAERHADGSLTPLSVGTDFLSGLHQLVPLPLIRSVATFNPLLMADLARGNVEPLRAYRKHFGHPLGAANLCGSLRGQTSQGVKMADPVYDAVVRALAGPAGAEISN